jgi:uncharacterized membrane protein
LSDLIIIGYPDESTAEKVWAEVVALERDYLLDLADAAIIRRAKKGKLHVTAPAHHTASWGALSGFFWGVVIGLIFFLPLAPVIGVAGGLMGAALGEAKDLGIKDDFKLRVQELVKPGTSAILMVVRKATTDKVVEGLQPYGGTILQSSLSHDAEEKLMKALHGDDPSSGTWEHTAGPVAS